jgi:hypothetical protein
VVKWFGEVHRAMMQLSCTHHLSSDVTWLWSPAVEVCTSTCVVPDCDVRHSSARFGLKRPRSLWWCTTLAIRRMQNVQRTSRGTRGEGWCWLAYYRVSTAAASSLSARRALRSKPGTVLPIWKFRMIYVL